MKKCTFILAVAAVSFALVGCEKKSSVEQQASGELVEKTFYANQGGKQKTTLDPSLATLWSEGDAIKVYPETGGAGNDFTLESGAGESAATFTGLTTLSDVYVAFYPAGAAQSISGSTVTFNIPATQTITNAGSFDTNTVPMVGYTTDNTLAMKNVGSLFELGLKAKEGTPTVVKIELMGNDGEYLAGDFTVDASVSGQPTATYSENGFPTLTVNCGEYSSGKYQGIALNSTDYTKFYISIPAGVFTAGFYAILTDAEDNVAEVTTNDNLSKGAAKITKFEAENIEFVTPGSTVVDACGNEYSMVPIGDYMWLTENIHCGMASNGYSIDQHFSGAISAGTSCYYEHSGEYLYTWIAAVGASSQSDAEDMYGLSSTSQDYEIQGVCPDGFHIATRTEYDNLISNGGPSGTALKTEGWGTNETGFNAKQVGQYKSSMTETLTAQFWTATIRGYKNGQYYADYFKIANTSVSAAGNEYVGIAAKSVRCVAPL